MPTKDQLLAIIAIQTEIAKQGLDLGNTMALVVERTLPLIEADGAAIEFAEGDEMVYRAASGIGREHLGLKLKLTHSLSGLCLSSGEIIRCDDSECDDRVNRSACQKVGLRSMIVVPLRHHGETVGVLKAMSSRPNKFTDKDTQLLGLLCEVVAAAMYFATKYSLNELFHRATRDEMTGLANRALFIDRLRGAIARHERDKHAVSVLIIDMDGLKLINDSAGHRTGDAAITEFARRLKASARQSDTVARLGGDEFGLILSPVDLSLGLASMIQRIYAEIERPLHFEGETYHLHASIGAAEYPADGDDMEGLLDVADQRMYRVKQEHHRRLVSE